MKKLFLFAIIMREIKENRQDKNLQVEVRGQHEG